MTRLVDVGGPQFNPNPSGNQQGTLFSNRRLNAANRTGDEVGHKGYSKNRLNEVRESLPVDVHLTGPAVKNVIEKRHAGEGDNPMIDEEDRDIARRMTTQHVHDVVARSTMPMTDLANLPHDTRLRTQDMGQAAGQWNRQTHVVSIHGPLLDENRRGVAKHEGSDTILHELGHGVDAVNSTFAWGGETRPIPGVTTNTIPLSSPEVAAQGEGFADAYAHKHVRGKRGAPVDRSLQITGYDSYNQSDWENYAGSASTEHQDPEAAEMGAGTATEEYRWAREYHNPSPRAPEPPTQLSSPQFSRSNWNK